MERRVLLSAYTLSDVAYFGTNTSGAAPNSTLAVDSSENFYGTTAQGGAYGLGTVFEIASGSQEATALVTFNGTNGLYPNGVTVDASGNLYGTTAGGGTGNDGTVFEIAKGSQAITTLASFNGTNGKEPETSVILDASGNLFGTTTWGGTSNAGTLFEIRAGSTAITTLVMLPVDSQDVSGLALDPAGDLYGTASAYGTVFELPKGSNVLTTLASFNGNGADGAAPGGVALDAAGNLYGVANQGGANGFGTVFELASGTHAITTLASFNGTNGEDPEPCVTLDAAGNLYGTTLYGGATHSQSNSGYNTVFEVAKGSNAITALTSFANQTSPIAGLTLGPDGNLYGTTEGGGAGGTGMMFEVADSSGTVTPLASFDQNDGVDPFSPLTMDAAGDLFGTTANGGAFNDGTVFEIAKGSGAVTVLAVFNGANGSGPGDGLMLDAAGNIFGTTRYGGSNGSGTVFELAAGSGTITTLASLPSFAYPLGGITLDASGDIFGTSEEGGAYNAGMVFEIPAGTNILSTYASFNRSTSGFDPQSGVTFDRHGNLYGMTYYGGTANAGTIFEIPSGSRTITTLASLSLSVGDDPVSRIVVDGEGNLYGTAGYGGPNAVGTVFELPKGANTITDLCSFANYGSYPSDVALDAFGNLYGTLGTSSSGNGSVFEIARGSSAATILATFNGANGDTPFSGVMVDPLGNLYGTTNLGGAAKDGALFELTANTSVTLASAGGANPADPGQPLTFTATVNGGGVPDWETVLLVDASSDDQVVTGGLLHGGTASLTIPAGTLSPGTHEFVAAYSGDATFTASQSAPYAQIVKAAPPPPALVGAPVINGDNPNGLFTASGQPTPGLQRSMIEDIVYTFNEPVTISDANAAFTVVGTGPHAGIAPSTLLVTAVPGTNGTQWAVSLTGKADGVLASIANGEYTITINPNAIFAAPDGVTAMTSGRTDSFYRLFGDINGDRVVNVSDEFQFSKAMNTYTPIFDVNGDGTVNLADEFQASRSFSNGGYIGDGFVTTI
jgi:uncharacterized repeat protein (TIGR03803 family)